MPKIAQEHLDTSAGPTEQEEVDVTVIALAKIWQTKINWRALARIRLAEGWPLAKPAKRLGGGQCTFHVAHGCV